MSRASRTTLIAAALLLVGSTSAAAAPAVPSAGADKSYTAGVTPTRVDLPAATGAAVSVVLSNAATSTHPFASAEVRLPEAAGLDAARASVSRTGWSVSLLSAPGASVLRLVSTGQGTTNAVPPGQSVALTLPVAADAAPGTVAFTTAVKQSNDFSGAGNDFVRAGDDPTLALVARPMRLEFVQGPSTVQQSPAAPTAGTTPVLVMCPAPQVRVVDASGATVTSLPPTSITLSSGNGDAGLRLDGSSLLTRSTSAGVATFGSPRSADGTCARGLTAGTLGLDYTLSATAVLGGTTRSTVAAETFDVLGTYALCAATCTSAPLSAAGTTARVSATGGTGAPDLLTFSVGQDDWTGACNPEGTGEVLNPERAVVTVDLADHDKAVQLRWSRAAVQWATDNGVPGWDVCFAAVYDFPTADGPTARVGDWYVGVLPECPSRSAATSPCVADRRRSAGEQLATVVIPDVEGDPRMI